MRCCGHARKRKDEQAGRLKVTRMPRGMHAGVGSKAVSGVAEAKKRRTRMYVATCKSYHLYISKQKIRLHPEAVLLLFSRTPNGWSRPSAGTLGRKRVVEHNINSSSSSTKVSSQGRPLRWFGGRGANLVNPRRFRLRYSIRHATLEGPTV